MKLEDIIENLKIHNMIYEIDCKIEYPIFYINMDRNTERKEYMEIQLNKISFNFFRIRGINGYKITNTKEDTVDGIHFKNSYSSLTKSEIGCTLAHIMAIKEAYEYGKQIAMICEDDVMFDTCSLIPNLNEVVSKAPPNWEILQLCQIGGKNENKDFFEIYENIKDFKQLKYIQRSSSTYFWSTACYLINLKGMRKILDIVLTTHNIISINFIDYKNLFPSNGNADTYIYDLAITYTVLPALFIVNNIKLNSTIHIDHTPYHLKSSLAVLSIFNLLLSHKHIEFSKTLLNIDDIMKNSDQDYFLSSNTIRNIIQDKSNIIKNINIGIFKDIYSPKIESEILKKFKLKYRKGEIGGGYELGYIHQMSNIEVIISLYYKEKNYIWCPLFFTENNGKSIMGKLKFDIFNTKQIDFLNRIFHIPNPIEQYLINLYGIQWKMNSNLENIIQYPNFMYNEFGKEGQFPKILTVWQYWETKQDHIKPGYIDCAMDTVRKACEIDGLNYVRLSPDNLLKYIDNTEIPENWNKITEIAHKADYLRAIILYKYGGLWLDADNIAMNSLKPILTDLSSNDWVVFYEDEGPSIGIFATRQFSPLLKQWIDKMNIKISKNTTFNWTEIGFDILFPLWKNWLKENVKTWRYKIYDGNNTCFPLGWKKWEDFFKLGKSSFLKRDFQPAIIMYNALFPKWFKNMDRKQFEEYIKYSDIVIADLYRQNKFKNILP